MARGIPWAARTPSRPDSKSGSRALTSRLRGTATSCASPTERNSVRGAKPGQSRSLPHASPRRQHLPARTLRAPRHHGTADALVSARDRRGRSTDMLRASPRNATRPEARRQPLRRGSARSQDRASPSVRAALRRCKSHPPVPTRQCAGFALAAMSRSLGIPAPPPATSHPKAPPASCHPPLRTGLRSGISPVYPIQ
jgi:hypothetical protein